MRADRAPAPPGAGAIQGFFPAGLSRLPRSASGQGAIQLKVQGQATELPNGRASLAARGSGQPIPEPVRRLMEGVFGADFSGVRIHVGPQAAALGALAFTQGSQIHFAPGQYAPGTAQGRRLLAHELTHVVQQRAGRVRNPFGGGVAVVQDPRLEAEAERMAARCAVAQPWRPGAVVQRASTGSGSQPGTAGATPTAAAAASTPAASSAGTASPAPPAFLAAIGAAATSHAKATEAKSRATHPYSGASVPGVNGLSQAVNLLDDHDVDGQLHRLNLWNRADLITRLQAEYKRVRGRDIARGPMREDDPPRIPSAAGAHRWIPESKDHPQLPAGPIAIHFGSISAFLRGEVGQAFTGVVMLESSGRAAPKIYLHPNQPAADGKYAAQFFPDDTKGRVYQEEAPPVVHGGPSATSHGALVDLINQKARYRGIVQEGRHYVGFTVIKGGAGMPNRYSFQSNSSNTPTFRPAAQSTMAGIAAAMFMGQVAQSAGGYSPASWGRAIAASIEGLSRLERQRGRDMAHATLDARRRKAPARLTVELRQRIAANPVFADADWKYDPLAPTNHAPEEVREAVALRALRDGSRAQINGRWYWVMVQSGGRRVLVTPILPGG